MAEFLIVSTPEIPALGQTKQIALYRGDHTNEDAAVEVAAQIFGKSTGDFLGAYAVGSMTRYVCTATHTWTAAPG